MLCLARECDYKMLMDSVLYLSESYKFLSFNYLTKSVLGRGIPLIKLGEGAKNYYYVGAHHGAERITSAVLLRFIEELCQSIKVGRSVCGMDMGFLLKGRTLIIIPQLNVDGADISANGAVRDSLMYQRLLQMNGSDDFTVWQANARGVDLNHNYDAGFAEYKVLEKSLGIEGGGPTRYSGTAPESEPETAALAGYMRFNMPQAVITLHTQGREIYCESGGEATRSARAAAEKMAMLSGYRIAAPKGAAAYGGLTDYCIQKLGVPSFTLECGRGKNPLPPSELFGIYAELRSLLFGFPAML